MKMDRKKSSLIRSLPKVLFFVDIVKMLKLYAVLQCDEVSSKIEMTG